MAFNKEKVMDAARKFVDKGQIDKAVKEYLRIVHEDPKDVRVWLKIGDLYAKKGSKQEAIETYLKVARFYHEQGFFLKAVAVYRQILKLDQRLVEVILKLAELYRQLGLMSEAMQHYEQVAAHFHREGNTKEALATVKKLVDLDPENIATRIKLAELYSKEGLVEGAGNEFKVACEQLRRQGRQDDFIKVAERLLWHKPDNHELQRELAGLYLRRNDPRRALQKLQVCFKADTRDVETLGLLAQAFQALDQKAKTVSVLKELARIHVENKQRDKATEVYRKILEFVPTDADALAFLGAAAAPSQPAASVAAKQPPPSQPSQPPPPVAGHSRGGTPFPAALRQAADARFNITTDLPAFATTSARMTGSMPLIDEQNLGGVDFALPEYDDGDFSADMEPAPDPRLSHAGEMHAEEISKILAETDVYVKYGLHQKALDHLRRVFGLDPENVEAHERMKDILVSQGREQEAEVELLKLAELVAPGDPDRAEVYLQELLAMDGTHTGAFDLARRFRLRVARMNSSVSSEVDYGMQGGNVAPVESELEDLELGERGIAGRSAIGVARARDSIDDFDPHELIHAPIAHGSPTPSRVPVPPLGRSQPIYETDKLEHEFDRSQPTQQMAGEPMSDLPEDDDGSIVDGPPQWVDEHTPTPFEVVRSTEMALDDHLDAAGEEINSQLAAELAADHLAQSTDPVAAEDMPFDPDEARAFDVDVPKIPSGTDAQFVTGFEETVQPHPAPSDTSSYENLAQSASYDPYGTEAVQTPPYDPTDHHPIDSSLAIDDIDDAPVQHPRAESNVEDDLDAADFYVGQGMFPEAREVLHTLLARYPNHLLVAAKLREVEALASGQEPIEVGVDSIEQEISAPARHGGMAGIPNTENIDLDEIEEVPPDEFEEVHSEAAGEPLKKRRPTVMLQKPVDESDAETHYDLGLAYKEMGLHDEAIKAFEKALRAPSREVQCRLMIGMCMRDAGNASEAIHSFKQGLHAEPSDRERQSLYYEIGATYDAIGDEGEALYYFDMVTKRDPSFADAAMRADQLRVRVGRGARLSDDDL